MTFKEPKKKWFQTDLKKSRLEFKNVENIIELAKLKYSKQNHLVEWLLGISTAMFISFNISNITDSKILWIKKIGICGYVITLLLILISIFLHIKNNYRQNKAFSWLYREKDKQENNRRN